MGQRQYFGVNSESKRIEVRTAGESATCCGVNLAFAGVGLCGFSLFFGGGFLERAEL
jgi:hypothetical protein